MASAELVASVATHNLVWPASELQSPNIELLHRVQAAPGTPTLHVYAIATDETNTRKRSLGKLSFANLEWQQDWNQPLPNSIQLLQLTAGASEESPPRLLGYASGNVVELNASERTFSNLQALATIYRNPVDELEADIDFARDLTGDGHADLLMPNFTGWQFSPQQADGNFAVPQSFGPQPVMGMGSARYAYFTAHEPYVFDYNGSGLNDLGFWNDGALQVYQQKSAGVFDTNAITLDPGIDIESDAFFSLSVGTDADNPDGRQAVLDTIEDLNGDGLADLLVYSVTGEGLFGKETSYEIHLGKKAGNGTLEFEQRPSSAVGSGGIQVDVERKDLDGDGQLEMLVTSFDLGLRSIIRALLSRSVSLDLSIYQLRDGRYPDKPNVKRSMTAKLDLANGDIFVPAVLAGDVNGDDLDDLLVQDGDSELKVFLGTGDSELFVARPQSIKLNLPRSGGSIEVVDVDTDGVDELLLHIPANTDADSQPKVSIVRFLEE